MTSTFAAIAAALLAWGSPADDVHAALRQANDLPAEARQQYRYLTLDHLPANQRTDTTIGVVHLLNHLSRNRLIYRPESVDLQLSMLRVDLAALADPKNPNTFAEVVAAWEALATIDPRFHIRTNVATSAGIKPVTVEGGWTDLHAAAELRALSGSQGAVLAADFFIANAAIPPVYYQFLAVPTKEADLFTLLGVNSDLLSALAADGAANIVKSLITGRPRRLIRAPAPLGVLWRTKDPGPDQSPDGDPFRAPVDATVGALVQRFNFAAGEHIWTLPNGYLGYALYNAAGQRQNDANGIGVTDHLAPAGNQSLVPMLSCVRCHEKQGEAGLQPFVDGQHLLTIRETTSPEIQQRTLELYQDQDRLQRQLTRDREDHTRAVQLATSTTPKAATEALVAVYERYTYDSVDIATAAAECGLTVELFRQRTEHSTDHGVQQLRDGVAITRKTWEASFHAAMTEIER